MPFEVTLINILFLLTIFSLLMVKILQLFKNYFVPYIFELIKQEKAIRIELIEKENFVKSTQNKIENQIINQKKLFLNLEKNMQKWYNYTQLTQELAEKELLEIKSKVEKKKSIQRKNYVLTTTYLTAMPKALDQARDELDAFYSDPKGKKAFDELVKNL